MNNVKIMPGQNGPHQRFKLSTSMYRKLKIFIMSKRKRMLQEKELDAQIDKRKRAREERRRLKEVEKSNLQSTVEQIETLTKKLEELRKQKQEAFSRFRTIVYEEQKMKMKQKEEADALLNVNIQFGSGPAANVASGATLGHPSTGAPHPHTMYMQAQPPTHVLHSRTTPTIYVPPPAAHQQPAVAKPTPQPSSQTTAHNPTPSGGPSLSLLPAKRRRSPSPPVTNTLNQFKAATIPTATSFASAHGGGPTVPQQQSQQSSSTGQPSAAKNALYVENPLSYHMQAFYRSNPGAPGSRVLPSANSPVTNTSYGKTLPPAPTSYRGSITTGQSAQQIQLQAAAFQFHQAAVQQQQQQQQQHIPKTIPNAVSAAAAAAAAAAAGAAGYSSRPGAPPTGPAFPPTTQPFPAYSFQPNQRRFPY